MGNRGDAGSIPGLGRFPGEGNGNPLQYSCQENPVDGGTWWATVYGIPESIPEVTKHTHYTMQISQDNYLVVFTYNQNEKLTKTLQRT